MFKENFENICMKKGLSPTAVCLAVGISKSNYSNWGNSTKPRNNTLLKLSNYLDVPIEELLDNEVKQEEHSKEEKQLVSLISQLTDEETKELSNYLDFIISKRPKK